MHNRIRELRELRGMTQSDLAKRLGTSNVSVGRYERESHRVTLTILEQIASALRVSPVDIITSGDARLRETAVHLPILHTNGETMAFDTELAGELGAVDHLEVVRVEDDSMEPTMRIGDICIIDTSEAQVKRDGLYVLGVSGRLIVRRVAFNPIRKAFVASADNKLYPDVWDIHDDELQFLGRVVYAGRRY